MKKQITTFALLATMASANAATIAIVDSGSDIHHKDLASKAWINQVDIADNNRDEDRNGYQDDVYGWNFAESNNQVIDYSYAWSDTADVRRFFEIQLKSYTGQLTQEDRIWANSKLQDEQFIREISVYGNWMHGTHVMGIAAEHSNDAKMLAIKLIPTEVKLPGQENESVMISTGANSVQIQAGIGSKVKDFLIKKALGTLATQQSTLFTEIGAYMNGHKVDVMNGSFGTSFIQMQSVIAELYKAILKNEPTAADVKKYTEHYFSELLTAQKSFTSSAPRTLFVFAAGNDGTNNDEMPVSPANIVADNKITVAATLGDQALADFSNYGEKNVDIAAPGVGIYSQSPMDAYIHVSGTSQAAPYVAGVAGAVKDANPSLDYKGIKEIVLGTVDVKSWLKGKVRTSGLVNAERAVRAAQLSGMMSVKEAIAQSYIEIPHVNEFDKSFKPMLHQVPNEFILSLPSTVVVK